MRRLRTQPRRRLRALNRSRPLQSLLMPQLPRQQLPNFLQPRWMQDVNRLRTQRRQRQSPQSLPMPQSLMAKSQTVKSLPHPRLTAQQRRLSMRSRFLTTSKPTPSILNA